MSALRQETDGALIEGAIRAAPRPTHRAGGFVACMQAAPAARRITGALDVKDLLDVIFRDFCIIP